MDSIVFSADPSIVDVVDAIRHLETHTELYWEVGFRINRDRFTFPMLGFVHICGRQVKYKVTIQDIIPFSPTHYSSSFAKKVKPEIWIKEWELNENNVQAYPWKFALVLTRVDLYSYNTSDLINYSSRNCIKPPRNYTRVLLPE